MVGNVEDDLERCKDVDLVVEAIIEKVELRPGALFQRLEKIVPAHTIDRTNTSKASGSRRWSKVSPTTLRKRFMR